MKRCFAFLAAALLALQAAACGETPAQPRAFTNEHPTGATLSLTFDHAFRGEQLLPETELSPDTLYTAGNYLIWRNFEEDAPSTGHACDLTTGTEVSLPQHGYPVGAEETDSGCEILWEASETAEDGTFSAAYTLAQYDSALQEISAADVTDRYALEEGWDGSIYRWTRDFEGGEVIVTCGHEIRCYAPDGTYRGEVKGSFAGASAVFRGNDGYLYAVCAAGDCYAAAIDPEALTAARVSIPGMPTWCTEIAPGNAEYTFFCGDEAFLYGVNVTDRTVTQVLDYSHSDVNAIYTHDFLPLPDGGFAAKEITLLSPTESACRLWHFTPRSQAECDSMRTITVAAFQMDENVEQLMRLWNRRSDGIRFVIKEYYSGFNSTAEDYENAKDAFSDFQNDLLAGTVPDILFVDQSDYEQLSNKGLFEDLYAWMDNDPDFREEDYLMNFFDALAYRGHLERMSFRFSVNALVGKTEFLGASRPMTAEEFAQLIQTMPEGMSLFGSGYDREYALQLLIGNQLDSWIDYEGRTCSFDSPAFVQLLTLCKEYVPERVGLPDDDAYQENRALLSSLAIVPPAGYMQQTVGRFGEEPLTILGCPQAAVQGNGGQFEPQGCFAVSANSLYKAEIWDFIKFALNEENQNTHGLGFGLPVNRTVLRELFAQAVTQDDADFTAYRNGTEITLRHPTEAEVQAVLDYIDKVESASLPSAKLQAIVSEEAAIYFAGDTDAASAAARIQSRAEIYLAETA